VRVRHAVPIVVGALLGSVPLGAAPPSPTTAASAVASPAPTREEDVRRVSYAELQPLLARGEAVLVDTRPAGAFAQSHVAGALNIPLAEVDKRYGELPKDKLIAAYCT
jgi:hypothetical protein